MLFMMSNDFEFCDVMTSHFIGTVAINMLYFLVQMVPELIFQLYNLRIIKQKEEKDAENL
mgnify:CR=1 FL=1